MKGKILNFKSATGHRTGVSTALCTQAMHICNNNPELKVLVIDLNYKYTLVKSLLNNRARDNKSLDGVFSLIQNGTLNEKTLCDNINVSPVHKNLFVLAATNSNLYNRIEENANNFELVLQVVTKLFDIVLVDNGILDSTLCDYLHEKSSLNVYTYTQEKHLLDKLSSKQKDGADNKTIKILNRYSEKAGLSEAYLKKNYGLEFDLLIPECDDVLFMINDVNTKGLVKTPNEEYNLATISLCTQLMKTLGFEVEDQNEEKRSFFSFLKNKKRRVSNA